jgi:hypothetical protein
MTGPEANAIGKFDGRLSRTDIPRVAHGFNRFQPWVSDAEATKPRRGATKRLT